MGVIVVMFVDLIPGTWPDAVAPGGGDGEVMTCSNPGGGPGGV